MNYIPIFAIGVTATITFVVLKHQKPEYSSIISIAFVIAIGAILLPLASELVSRINVLASGIQIQQSYINILFKTLGICFLTEQASNIADEHGAKSISSNIELCGKVSVLVISLPLFEYILSMVSSLFNQV